MALSIRPMMATDRAAVLDLLIALTAHEATLSADRATGIETAEACLADDSEKAATHGGAQIVADIDGMVVGYLALRRDRLGPFMQDHLRDSAYIENIVVAGSQRGTGIGQALLSEAERFARAAGCGVIHLSVLEGNEAALKAYRAAGFHNFALEMEKKLD